MTFLLSKLLWPLLQPSALIWLSLLGGTALSWTTRWRRAGRRLVSFAAVTAWLLAVLPTGPWLMQILEERFPPPGQLDRVDGIIVLGGAIDALTSAVHGQPALTAAAERMTAAATLARRYPDAMLVFSGGSGSLMVQGIKEAPVARELLDGLGVDANRLILEDLSRDTYENAAYSRMLLQPQPGERWVLVTSAFHMPRAAGVFAGMDWPVIPYPVDFRSHADKLGPTLGAGSLDAVTLALHEWIGLVAYRLVGRTRDLFPAPMRSEQPVPPLASPATAMAQHPVPFSMKDRTR